MSERPEARGRWNSGAIRAVLAAVLTMIGLCSCESGKAVRPYHYSFEHGKTALLRDGRAAAPRSAPAAVHRAVQAGNELQGARYCYGGGHRVLCDPRGYDCSGTASYVLNKAGLMKGSMPSQGFKKWGEAGEGRWITLYAKSGHVFMVIAGLRLDTGTRRTDEDGPRWRTRDRATKGFIMRHPPGL